MCLHDLLADITLAVLVILCILITHLVVGSSHLLHFHIGRDWFLSIDLTNEGLHTFCHALINL